MYQRKLRHFKPDINKTLHKAIMKRSQIKNKAKKTRNATHVSNYKKQRSYVVKLNNQFKKDHFDRLNPEKDSKPSENDEFLAENNKIAKTFDSFFEKFTDSLNLFNWYSKLNFMMIRFKESYSIFQT